MVLYADINADVEPAVLPDLYSLAPSCSCASMALDTSAQVVYSTPLVSVLSAAVIIVAVGVSAKADCGMTAAGRKVAAINANRNTTAAIARAEIGDDC